MTIHPDEAARSLAEVRERQSRALAAGLIPRWYWWAIALLITLFCAGIESERPALIAATVVVFVLGVATAVFIVVTRAKAQMRHDLLGPRFAVAIAGFVLGAVAVTLGVALALQAADVGYPATLASLVNVAILVIGGPILMRKLHALAAARTLG